MKGFFMSRFSLKRSPILRDSLLITAVSLGLQLLSLLFNVFLSSRLGAANVGVVSLINSFFSFTSVVSCGNAYLCVSRLASEELGAGGNPDRVLKSAMLFSVSLSCAAMLGIMSMADRISALFLKNAVSSDTIKFFAAALPVIAICSCLKGYFNAFRSVSYTLVSDTAEFLVRGGTTALLVQLFVIRGAMTLLSAITAGIYAGLGVSLFILLISKLTHRHESFGKPKTGLRKYIISAIPVMLNSSIGMTLSIANDVLMPLTLKQYGSSGSAALAEFGMFDAIILPVLFFPSSLVSSAGQLMVPEISRARGAEKLREVRRLTEKAIRFTLLISVFAAGFFVCFGGEIGKMLSDERIVSVTIPVLAPIIPFIYLEIILEGIIKGMGRHAFSTMNYICEYIIRISVLLICVPVLGFTGIIVSYVVSNSISNSSRLIFVCRKTGLSPKISEILIIPLLCAASSCAIGKQLTYVIESLWIKCAVFVLISGALYFFFYRSAMSTKKAFAERAKNRPSERFHVHDIHM